MVGFSITQNSSHLHHPLSSPPSSLLLCSVVLSSSLSLSLSLSFPLCCVASSIARAVAFRPYCDVLWMETKSPVLSEAVHFARSVHSRHPSALLAYNLSPSFNWTDMGDAAIRSFQSELGAVGFVWMFITLAGFHSNGLAVARFARAFSEDFMLAYVRDIQREEVKEGVELLKHQQWSGAELVDFAIHAVTGGLGSTQAMGQGNTEQQFHIKAKM